MKAVLFLLANSLDRISKLSIKPACWGWAYQPKVPKSLK